MIKIPSLYKISVCCTSYCCRLYNNKRKSSLILILWRKPRLTRYVLISHRSPVGLQCLCRPYYDVGSDGLSLGARSGYWRPPVSIWLGLVVVLRSWGLNWAVEGGGGTDWWNGVRGVRPENSQTTVTRPQAPTSTNTRTGAACWTCRSETL